MDDSITMAVKIAQKNYEQGHITQDQLIEFMRVAINAVAKCNGYEQKFGLPFPEQES